MGVATIAYTYHGGMTAVIWTDVIQLVHLSASAPAIAAVILLRLIPGGWVEGDRRVGRRRRQVPLFDFTLRA